MATLADLPARIAARGPRPALVRRCGEDGFRDWSTTDLIEAIQQGAAGLLATGLAAGDRLAIVSESRPEWILVDLAAQTIGVVTVPIYPTLPAPQVRHILADSGARVAVVSDRIQAAKVQEVRHLLPALELVVIIDPGTPANAADPQAGHLGLGTSVIAYAALLARGRDRLATDPSVGPAIEARRAAVGGRIARHHHLHLRHDGRAQGRDADASQHRLERRSGDPDLPADARRRRADVPAAQPLVRTDGGLRLPDVGPDHRLRREPRHDRARPADHVADADDGRPAGVREAAGPRAGLGRRGVGAAALAVPDRAGARGGSRSPHRRGARTPWRRPAGATGSTTAWCSPRCARASADGCASS